MTRLQQVIGLVALVLAGCAEEEQRLFRCQTWCNADASDVVELNVSAVDELAAQDQVFDTLGGLCSNGALRKCTCEETP